MILDFSGLFAGLSSARNHPEQVAKAASIKALDNIFCNRWIVGLLSRSGCHREDLKNKQEHCSKNIMSGTNFFTIKTAKLPASVLGITVVLAAMAGALQAQPIPVSNPSFESQVVNPNVFPVDFRIDSWQKLPNPGYPESGEFTWDQTAGMFMDTNPYGNSDGNQLAYVLGLPGAGIFQDNQSTDWNNNANGLNATYQAGLGYQLTVGVFGKALLDGANLELSLYYRNDLNAIVTVNSTSILYDAEVYSLTPPLNLFDFTVNVPVVQETDAWFGRNIGIKIQVGPGPFNQDFAYWDIDNVRLSAIPEPASLSLAVIGLGALLAARMRSSRR